MDEGKAVNVVCLDFSKAFDTTCHSVLLEQLAVHGWDGCTLTVNIAGCLKPVVVAGWQNPGSGGESSFI